MELLEPRFVPAAGFNDVLGFMSSGGDWWAGASNGEQFSNGRLGGWTPTIAWKDVQAGDFNGDGLDDVVGRNPSDGVWWVGISNGWVFNTTPFGVWSPGINWTDVLVGDLTGDGKDDIVGRDAASGQWWAGISNGLSFTNQYMGSWSPATWLNVKLVDLTGDGKDDLIGRLHVNGQWWAGISSGTAFTNQYYGEWTTSVSWADVVAGDWNQDGRIDLAGRIQSNGQWWAAISGASGFTSRLMGSWSAGVTWTDVRAADLNGDLRDDIVGRIQSSGQWWGAVSNGSAFVSQHFGNWATTVSWTDVRVVDVDNNGKADILGRNSANGQWWVGVSTGTSIQNRLFGAWSTTAWQYVLVGNFAAPQSLSGSWALKGLDLENTSWLADVDLVQTGTSLAGHFDWQDSSFSLYGREYFTGQVNLASMSIHLVGTQLENSFGLGTSIYDAKLDGFGRSMLRGSWGGGSVVASNQWQARLSTLAAASAFASGLDGWTVSGPATSQWVSTNGDPGGYMRVQDAGAGGASKIEAPLSFRRDWRSASFVPGLLSVDIELEALDQFVSTGLAIEISGAGGSARFSLSVSQSPSTAGWRTYLFALDSSLWTVTSGTWNALLSSVSSLRIGADFADGNETVGFDNIRLLLP